jgi:hypothetical protein
MADHTLEDLGEVGDAPVTRGFEADTEGLELSLSAAEPGDAELVENFLRTLSPSDEFRRPDRSAETSTRFTKEVL